MKCAGVPLLAAALLAAALLAAGCVQLGFERQIVDRVPDPDDVAALEPGFSGITEVLRRFGAPLDVWEGTSGAPILAYGGLRSRAWNVTASVPISDQQSASFAYTDRAARTHGVVVILDDDLRVRLVRAGLLRDLRLETERRRPAAPDEEGGEPGESGAAGP